MCQTCIGVSMKFVASMFVTSFFYLVCIWPETHLTSAVNVVMLSNLRLSAPGLDKDHKFLLTFHPRKPKRNDYCLNTVNSDKVIFIAWVCWHNVHRQKSCSKCWVKGIRSRTCIGNFETCWSCFRAVGSQSAILEGMREAAMNNGLLSLTGFVCHWLL
jgi:hypothetical protein